MKPYNRHKPQCNEFACYCLDENQGDPMCDCGNPGWCCVCHEYELEEEQENNVIDYDNEFGFFVIERSAGGVILFETISQRRRVVH